MRFPFVLINNRNLGQISLQAFKRRIGQLIHRCAVKADGFDGTVILLGQQRSLERRILDYRALERNAVQPCFVKLDADEGLAVKHQPCQIAICEIYPVEHTIFKDGVSKIGHRQIDAGQFGVQEFCASEPRLTEVGAHKDRFIEACMGQVKGGQVAVRQIRAVKMGTVYIALLNELPVKSAPEKSEPGSESLLNCPLWAVTPAKSLSPDCLR